MSSSVDQRAENPNARVGDRSNVRGELTRRRILAAAERLFAERGVAAVPLRDIGAAAGQRNHAAVQYHFGDREELVSAVLEYRGGESDACRSVMVTDIMAEGRVPIIHDVVAAFAKPLAIHIRVDNHYLAFLSLLITERGGYDGLPKVHIGQSVAPLRGLLARLAPEVPAPILDERWAVAQTSAVHALARYQVAERAPGGLPAARDLLVDDLINFLAAGLTAPVSAKDPRRVSLT